MKLIGNENSVITIKKNDYSLWDIFNSNIDDLINTDILNDIKRWKKVEKSGKRFDINSLSIGSLNITKDSYVNLYFSISKKNQKDTVIQTAKYKNIKCYDFYNMILELCNKMDIIYDLNIDDIYIKLSEIEVYPPLAFTTVGFINSNELNQYDLDGQISFLNFLLKNTQWKFENKMIVFPSLYNELDIINFINRYTLESQINVYNQQLQITNNCQTQGILEVQKELTTKIKKCKKENNKIQEEYISRHSIII